MALGPSGSNRSYPAALNPLLGDCLLRVNSCFVMELLDSHFFQTLRIFERLRKSKESRLEILGVAFTNHICDNKRVSGTRQMSGMIEAIEYNPGIQKLKQEFLKYGTSQEHG